MILFPRVLLVSIGQLTYCFLQVVQAGDHIPPLRHDVIVQQYNWQNLQKSTDYNFFSSLKNTNVGPFQFNLHPFQIYAQLSLLSAAEQK